MKKTTLVVSALALAFPAALGRMAPIASFT